MEEDLYDDMNGSYSLSYDIYDYVFNEIYPKPYEWFILTLFAVILLLALGGNTLVCYAVLRNEHMRTVTNYYIVNLSVADILVSLVCLVPTAMVDVTETWWFGELGCKLIPYFQVSPFFDLGITQERKQDNR